jgi:uncharacterized protein (TIGR02145 family)
MKTKLFLLGASATICLAVAGCDKTTPENKEPGDGTNPAKTEYSISFADSEGGSAVATVDGSNITKAAADVTVTITAEADGGYEFVKWTTTNQAVVFDDPTVATTTFMMPKSHVTIEAEFIREGGVRIGDVVWASRNVDAAGAFTASPEDYGGYFTFDNARTACPQGWRLPTKEELDDLIGSGFVWTTMNGVNGGQFGTDDDTVFLPASGQRSSPTAPPVNVGIEGFCWSSDSDSDTDGWYMTLSAVAAYCLNGTRQAGDSVRCVAN